ncbi:MAG: hypothetical protein ACLFWF_07715 [Alphaproteobacteria bacterium]
MKNLVLISALAAGLAAAAPGNAEAARLSVGVSAGNGHVDGYLRLAEHRDRYRGRRCQSWRRAHRRLHRRWDRVRLRRRVYNRRGHKVFIAHVRNHRGRRYRVRYNACTRRVTRVKPMRHRRWWGRHHRRHHRHHRRHGRCESWRYAHRKLHRRYDHVTLHRRTRNRRGHRIFIAHARNHHGRAVRVRYNACRGRITRVRPERHHRPY